MTIETIQKRIDNATKNLNKLNKKMERILRAQASNWEINPYGYYEGDIKYTQRDIDEAKASLEKYQQMLVEETDKASSRNVPVLVEFLNNWKERARSWYNDARNNKDRKDLKQKYEDASKEYHEFDKTRWSAQSKVRTQVAQELGASSEYAKEVDSDPRVIEIEETNDKKDNDLREAMSKAYDNYKDTYGEIDDMEDNAYYAVTSVRYAAAQAEAKANKQKYEPWKNPIKLTDEEKDAAWDTYIEKLLQKEWDRKYDRLLDDVIRITGTIDDASMLRINEKGDLDGFIKGQKGTAKINTFGAGGYNIQCFHYRTKVTKVK